MITANPIGFERFKRCEKIQQYNHVESKEGAEIHCDAQNGQRIRQEGHEFTHVVYLNLKNNSKQDQVKVTESEQSLVQFPLEVNSFSSYYIERGELQQRVVIQRCLPLFAKIQSNNAMLVVLLAVGHSFTKSFFVFIIYY